MVVRTWVTACMLGVAGFGLAADIPLSGRKLSIREKAGREPRIDLTCRDAAVTLPAPGTAGDPSIAGLDVVVLVDAGGGATIAVPGGAGWTVTPVPLRYRYKNPSAPAGGSAARKIELRAGKQAKVSTRGAPVAAALPSGGVLARIELASGDVLCARFDQNEIVRDEPGRLIGKNADPPASCDPPPTTSSSTSTPTTTSTTSTSLYHPCSPPGGGPPTCDGACETGTSCTVVPSFSHPETGFTTCLCLPDGTAPCGGYPQCGGACDAGNVCAAFFSDSNEATFCACTDPSFECAGPGPGHPEDVCEPGRCPPGSVCHFLDAQGTVFCGCGTP
jgi:hypothetical protein